MDRSRICPPGLALLFAAVCTHFVAAAAGIGDIPDKDYIVVFDGKSQEKVIQNWVSRQVDQGAEVLYRFHTFNAVRIRYPARSPVTRDLLMRDARVAFVGGRRRVDLHATPNDSLFYRQWALHNDGSEGYEHIDIDALRGWDYARSDTTVVIALLDRGFHTDHPDLAGVFMQGWDFYEQDDDPSPSGNIPLETHGTTVTGVVTARGDNGIGTVGVCWRARILPFRCYYLNEYVCAIDSATTYGVDIISNSWSISEADAGLDFDDLQLAIAQATAGGVIVVNSAGNDGDDIDLPENRIYPACFDEPLNLAVTCFTPTAGRQYNYGLNTVDIAAPGWQIYTTTTPAYGWSRYSGTSYSAPYVAGSLALIKSRYPGIGAQEAVEVLLDSAEFSPAHLGLTAGARRLNLYRALAEEDPVPPASPTDLHQSDGGTDFVTLTWTMPGEDGFSGTAEYYEIYSQFSAAGSYSPVKHQDLPPPGGTTVTDTIGNLGAGAELTCMVVVYDADRNSAYATTAAMTLGYPLIELPVNTLFVNLVTGELHDDSLFVRNVGGSHLRVLPVPADSYDWLTVVPDSVSIAPDDSAAIGFSFDVSGLCGPHVAGTVNLLSNDPFHPTLPVFVIAGIADTCEVQTSPAGIDFGEVIVSTAATTQLSVRNIGCVPLVVEHITFQTPEGCSAAPDSFSVQPGDSVQVEVSCSVDEEGAFATVMEIFSDDPFDNPLGVPVVGTGVSGVSVADGLTRPAGFHCLPNPANPLTLFAFDLPRPGRVEIRIHNLQGQVVRRLPAGFLSEGAATVAWDGTDDHGNRASSGVYLCRLCLDGKALPEVVKLSLIK